MNKTKICLGCKIRKRIIHFHKESRRIEGIRGECKICSCARKNAYVNANRD